MSQTTIQMEPSTRPSQNEQNRPILDGGSLGCQEFEALDEMQMDNIISCISQFCMRNAKKLGAEPFFTIQVWFAKDANKRFSSNTPEGAYLIIPKYRDNFVSKDLLNQALKIWASNMIPIEVCRDGRAMFFAIPMIEAYTGMISELYPAEKPL